jgi:hypothetical protein
MENLNVVEIAFIPELYERMVCYIHDALLSALFTFMCILVVLTGSRSLNSRGRNVL